MRHRLQLPAFLVILSMIAFVSSVFAGTHGGTKAESPAPVVQNADANSMRIEGEKRYHTNCGRCHAAPQKFPPRMMATVLRHMRVRATLTADDQNLILFYMTQ